jgi:integrase
MARRKTTKAKKGSVSVTARSQMLRLRWTYQGDGYQISLGLLDNPFNRSIAQKKASEIAADIAYGTFDKSLAKYKPQPEKQAEPVSTIALFEQFITYRKEQGTSGQAISTRYNALLANLKRLGGDIGSEVDARGFIDQLRSRQSARTSNQNLSLLKGFGEWATKHSHWDVNHFSAIASLKASKTQALKPFTRAEIASLLEASAITPGVSHYRDFISFLIHTGVRISEAIGVEWRHVDLDNGQVFICQSLSRGEDGSRSSRVKKSTKTGTARYIDLSPKLLDALRRRFSDGEFKPTDLVFTNPKGKAIDDNHFRANVWVKLCSAAKVEYRRPYNCRHSLLSHVIESGGSLPQAAAIAGHVNTKMVATIYAHMVEKPKMPDF